MDAPNVWQVGTIEVEPPRNMGGVVEQLGKMGQDLSLLEATVVSLQSRLGSVLRTVPEESTTREDNDQDASTLATDLLSMRRRMKESVDTLVWLVRAIDL